MRFLLLSWLLGAASITHAATYYVSGSGSDDVKCTSGATSATAWRSLSKQAHCIRPGDTIMFLPGVYVGISKVFWNNFGGIKLDGAKEFPITLKAYPSEGREFPVKFVGEFYLDASYLTIDGIEFTRVAGDSTRNLLMVLSGQGLVVRNSLFHGVADDFCAGDGDCTPEAFRDCIHLDGSNENPGSVTLLNNRIFNCREDAIDNTGRRAVVIDNNEISRSLRIQIKGGANGVLLRDNMIRGLRYGVVSGGMNCVRDMQAYCGGRHLLNLPPGERYQARNVVIERNTFESLVEGPVINPSGWREVDIRSNTVINGNHANGGHALIEINEPSSGYGVSAFFDAETARFCAASPRPTSCFESGQTRDGKVFWRLAADTVDIKVHDNKFGGRSATSVRIEGRPIRDICLYDNVYSNGTGSRPIFMVEASRYDTESELPACVPSKSGTAIR